MKNVHLTQLEYFVMVARMQSISQAAEALFVSQSAVSKQVLLLEKELGFPLFDRGYRKIRLTENGQLLLDSLLRCSADFTNTLEIIHRAGGGRDNLLRVAYVEYWDSRQIREPVEEYFRKNEKEIRLSLEPYMVSELADVLRRGNVDLVISFASAFGNSEALTTVPLGCLNCGILYARDLIPEKRSPQRGDFARVPMLETDDTSHPYRQELRAIMEKYGLNNTLISCPRFSAMLGRLTSGQGIFMVSDWTYLLSSKLLGFLPLGKDFPISAAYTQAAVDREKLSLIEDVIRAISDSIVKAPGAPENSGAIPAPL